MVDPYQRQLAQQRVGNQVGQANVQQMGGGIGDVLSSIGDAVGQNAIQDLQLKQQQEEDEAAFDAIPKRAEMQLEISQAEMEMRDQFGEDFAGYSDAVGRLVDEKTGALLAGITNKRVRARYEGWVADFRTATLGRSQEIERGKAVAAQRGNFIRGVGTVANMLRRGVSDEDFSAAVDGLDGDIEALNVDGDVKADLHRYKDEAIYAARLEGLIANGLHEKAGQMLDTGTLDAVLGEKTMASLRRDVDLTRQRTAREAELAQERAAREAELERERAAKALEDEMDAIRAKAKDGNATPAELRRAARIADQVGSPTDQYEIDKLTIENDTAAQYGQQSIPEISTSIRALEARVAKAGVNAPVSDRVTLETLRELRDGKMKEQAAEFAPLLRQGPQGTLSVLQQLDGYDRETRYQIANDAEDGLGLVSLLPDKMRALAVEGRAMPKVRAEIAPEAQVKAQMRKFVGRVANSLGADYEAYMDVAADIYTAASASRGRKTFDPAAFEHYVNQVFGAKKRQDGTMQGGLGTYLGNKVQLPDDYSQVEFDRMIAGTSFDGARDVRGKPVPKSFMVNNTIPEYVRDDEAGRPYYQFRDFPGQLVLGENGKPLLLRVPARQRR